jgi:hypothetical protein
MHCVAIIALGQGMVGGEFEPMFPLVGRQDSGSLAQRTNTIEGRENRVADELRSVGDAIHRRKKGFIHLERDDFVFSGSSGHGLLHRITTVKTRLPSFIEIG